MPTDIFPDIDIPVVTVIWNYSGLPPEEMEKRIVTIYERALTTTVNDIEHIESQSLTGIARHQGLLPAGREDREAIAQVTAIAQTHAAADAAGHHAAADHPVQRVERADPAARARQRDAAGAAAVRLRHRTSSAPSSRRSRARQMPLPYGGKQRQIMVDLDPSALLRQRLVADDVSSTRSACRT